jgi:DNA-binding transcriptional regulator YiaG
MKEQVRPPQYLARTHSAGWCAWKSDRAAGEAGSRSSAIKARCLRCPCLSRPFVPGIAGDELCLCGSSSCAHDGRPSPSTGGVAPLTELARELGVHVRTLQAAARTGRLQAHFSVRSVFGRPMRRASRGVGQQFLLGTTAVSVDRKYARLPCRRYPTTMTTSFALCRRRQGLTQAALAQRIGAAGKAVVYQWESRKRMPLAVLWQRVLDLA